MKYLLLFVLLSCSSLRDSKTSYDRDLSEFNYPFKVHHFDLKSQNQDLKMAFMDINSSSTKVALLLHGKNFSGFYWKRVIDELVKKNYRVIVPDQIGFGKSSKPHSYQYSFNNLALNTKQLLDSLGISSFVLVGHSMGGMLATHYTYQFPKSVKKMILINPIGLEPYLKYVEFRDPQFFYNIELNKTPEKFKAYQKKNYYDGNWKKEYDSLLVPYSGQMRGHDWDIVAWNNALTYGPIFNEDITRLFGEITNRVILIIGNRDKTGPGRNWKREGVNYILGDYKKLGKKAVKAFPNAKLYELEGLGHMPQFENFERFVSAFEKEI